MSNKRQRREEAIFHAALEIADPAQREAYLRQTCGEDLQLYRDVQELLEAHQRTGFESLTHPGPELEPPGTASMGEKAGDRVDRYQLLEPIGEGGFGVVWMAQQEAPVRRRVALKILKAGMDTRQVVARFEAERQALALMEHPNIARVFDGGATESGRPYFVMELVRGQPITGYCDERRLGTVERLELFLQVCQAVQHAHQKGVIHRDLKPGNILVMEQDGRAVPKVIDFGVAKALEQPLTEKTAFTRLGQMLGTPAYMSPEQASLGGLDIDTRSDVYSLGAVLYELLTGRPPFEPRRLFEAGFEAILRMIREEEPPRPSTRLGTLSEVEARTTAEQRRMEPGTLSRLLRGELDWIVMKALEKDRARRYETANGLAMDLLRYMSGEWVVARPPSAGYRFAKWIRRHRAAAATAALIAATLVAAATVSIGMAIKEQQARDEAEQGRHDLEIRLDASLINLAYQAWDRGDAEETERLLQACPPGRRQWEWDHLAQKLLEPVLTFHVGSNSTVKDLAFFGRAAPISMRFSPEGSRLSLAGLGFGASVFDANTGTLLLHFDNLDRRSLVEDGGTLLRRDGRRGASLVDITTGKKHPLPIIRSARGQVTLSENAAWAAVQGPNGISVVNIIAEKVAQLIPLPESGSIDALSFDGAWLATSSHHRTTVWDVRTGLPVFEVPHSWGPSRFDRQSRLLAVVGRESDDRLADWVGLWSE
jgi:tRNA A-37 threonylcarbamoyl transferase component Bud32